MHNLNKKNILNYLILFPILWTFTGLFLYPDGKKLIIIFIIISIISSIYLYGMKAPIDNLKTNKWLWLLGACSLFALIARAYYGYNSNQLRAFVSIFIYLAIFPQNLLTNINLKYLTVAGAITSLSFMLLQTFFYQHGRSWDINPIPYATFIASISVLSFYFLLQIKSKKHMFLWLITFATTLVPLFYSQSRGLWLALATAIFILLIKVIITQRKALYLLIPIALVSLLAFSFGSEKIIQRINYTKSEIQRINSGDLSTSIGLRFQMWQAAILLTHESPLIGLGDDHIKYKQALADKAIISQEIVYRNHYHNQYLNELIKYGIIGLMLLLLCIVTPCYYLIKNNNENTWPGLLIIIIFVIASLTDVPFQHGQPLTLYLLVMYITLYKITPIVCNKKVRT